MSSLSSIDFTNNGSTNPRTRPGNRRRRSFQGGVKSKHALARIRTVSTASTSDVLGGPGARQHHRLQALQVSVVAQLNLEVQDGVDDLLERIQEGAQECHPPSLFFRCGHRRETPAVVF